MLFIAQRVSAMVLGPLVFVHLGLILFAVRNGLTGAEILSRTQGSGFWAVFYTSFVIAVAIHAPIGLRNILQEWSRLPKKLLDTLVVVFALLLVLLGMRAVVAII